MINTSFCHFLTILSVKTRLRHDLEINVHNFTQIPSGHGHGVFKCQKKEMLHYFLRSNLVNKYALYLMVLLN